MVEEKINYNYKINYCVAHSEFVVYLANTCSQWKKISLVGWKTNMVKVEYISLLVFRNYYIGNYHHTISIKYWQCK